LLANETCNMPTSMFSLPCMPIHVPLEHLAPMDRYPRLRDDASMLEPGHVAFARQRSGGELRGIYAVGDTASMVVVGVVRSAADGRVCSVGVGHWCPETPRTGIDEFFAGLRAERGVSGRIEVCMIEGCAGSEHVHTVMGQAWRLNVQPASFRSRTAVFGVAIDPQGNIYRGDLAEVEMLFR